MFDLQFKNLVASTLGVKVAYRPDVPTPTKNIEKIKIAGRDGELITTDGTYSDIAISVSMNFITKTEMWLTQFAAIKKWLSGSGALKFSDSGDFFYKCKNVSIDTTYRTVKEAGEFTASFLCEPYTYITIGQNEYDSKDILLNPYYISKPTYKITGNGTCTLMVNNKTMTANVLENITINTDLMISYRDDGRMQNTAVAGNYEDIFLQEGENQIGITDGFDLKVIPNWRCL